MATKGIQIQPQELIQLRLSARSIKLDSQQRATASKAGLQHSRFRGRGVDFLESRNYQPGDDIRTMDWRVTARSGKPHTKIYQEERERPIITMLDFNASMFFGTKVAFKSVTAARLAALIGWAAIHNNDRIGAFLFNSKSHLDTPPTSGRSGVLRLIGELVSWTNRQPDVENELEQPELSAKGSLSIALQRLRRVTRPGSLIFLISDFYSLDEDSEQHLARLRQHNDIVACQIADALELAPPPPGRYGVTDGLHTRILDTRLRPLRDHYRHYFAEHHGRIYELTRQRNIPLITLATHDDIVSEFRRGLLNPIQTQTQTQHKSQLAH